MAYKKIYTFGPTFRTEKSNTKTHANEFWMIEPEVAFCDLEGIMDIEEEMLKYVVKSVLENCKEELEFCDKFIEKGLLDKLNKLVSSKFVRIDHKDVIDILKKADVKWENWLIWTGMMLISMRGNALFLVKVIKNALYILMLGQNCI